MTRPEDWKPYDPAKRAIDVAAAAIGLLLTAPIQAVVALLVRRNLGRPVLFRQLRPGRDGKPFTLIKFRSMRMSAPGSETEPDCARLTPFGATLRSTSLDELPTLWNVLRGDMSIVGPRPLLMEYLDRYTPAQAARHAVRPGVTGLAQVSGRNTLTWTQKFDADLQYIRERSLRLDARIIARTVIQVVHRRGITAPDCATMPEFADVRSGRRTQPSTP